ncbi:MAG TPA: winged helix-turn-helix transcriptional regulator [archaeon]|nr:winged helix-turn-helix transcriptional regulator [archaeon]
MAFELDLKDKRLLLELDLNAKASLKELSKKVKLSKEAVLYRTKRLESNGVITGYNTVVNFSRLGYTGFGVFCRFEGISAKQKDEIIRKLKEFPQVYWIGLCGGRFDLSFGLMCRTIVEFNRLYYDFKNEYSESLSETAIAIRSELRQHTRNYLLADEKTRAEPSFFFGQEPAIEQIDSMDSEILSAISTNARMPISEISSVLAKPAATISFRIKRLEERGIIQTYDTVVKVQQYGIQSYRLLLSLNKMDSALRKRLFSYAQENPRIWLAAETVGNWNFELVLEVESHVEFEKELSELKNLFGGAISGLEVLIMFDEDHYLNLWPFKKK